jgi:hypothetical protein
VSLIESRMMTGRNLGTRLWMEGNRKSARDVLQKDNGGTNSSHQCCMCKGIGKDK